MAKVEKTAVELSLVSCTLDLVPRKARRLITVDLVWPRVGMAKKTAAREAVFAAGTNGRGRLTLLTAATCDFAAEPWSKRILFREEIEGRCGVAVQVTENLSDEWLEKFFRSVAKAALKTGGECAGQALPGFSDIAKAPAETLAAMAGTYPGPRVMATGVIDWTDITPGLLEIPLMSKLGNKPCGSLVLKSE
jgi:hypothetical protein